MPAKAYKGMGMEGAVATWYTKNTGRDLTRFKDAARLVDSRVPRLARVLEVAPGPGYLAIELARLGHSVSTLDISRSFVEIALRNAEKAGAKIDVRHGDAAQMPFEDEAFDYVVCMAAFKNFTAPEKALEEMHRVLKPGRQASVFDLRKDATAREIAEEVRGMQLSAPNALFTRLTFRFLLLKRAYTGSQLEQLAERSPFGRPEVRTDGIGLELRLRKRG